MRLYIITIDEMDTYKILMAAAINAPLVNKKLDDSICCYDNMDKMLRYYLDNYSSQFACSMDDYCLKKLVRK